MPIKITRHKPLDQRYFFKEENSFQFYIFESHDATNSVTFIKKIMTSVESLKLSWYNSFNGFNRTEKWAVVTRSHVHRQSEIITSTSTNVRFN